MAVFKSDVHIDGALTGMSVEYKIGGFVGDKIFPTMPVKHDSDKYFVYSQGVYRDEDVKWEDGAERPRVSFGLETESYAVVQYAPTDFVTDKARRNQDDPLSLDVDTVNFLTKQVMLAFEADAKTKACTTTNYNASNTTTLSGTSQWSDLDNSDPIKDILTGVAAISKQLGVGAGEMGIVFGPDAWQYASQHPTFLDFVKRDRVSLVTTDDIRNFFNFREAYVGTAAYNSAAEGATVTQAFLWGDNVVIYALPPGGRPGPKSVQAGCAFRVNQPGGGTRVVERWRDAEKRADFFSVVDSWAIEWTCQDSSNVSIGAYLIYDTVA